MPRLFASEGFWTTGLDLFHDCAEQSSGVHDEDLTSTPNNQLNMCIGTRGRKSGDRLPIIGLGLSLVCSALRVPAVRWWYLSHIRFDS